MSSGFISEVEITERRKQRQEEWERVRSADQPLEVPEETHDPRSLFDRLQEQKNKRDMDYEEAHKLKNMIKGLDDDEVEFLDLVDRTKLDEERKKIFEEAKEMRDFKAAVASLQEKSLDEKLRQQIKNPQVNNKNSSGSGRSSQLRLLAGAVVKKSAKQQSGGAETMKGTKRKLSESEENSKDPMQKPTEREPCSEETVGNPESKATVGNSECLPAERVSSQTGGMKCIGVLPGLGSYQDSSDSASSSDTDQEQDPNHPEYDLLGRIMKCPKDKEKS